jgi:Helix-turn-helix domain
VDGEEHSETSAKPAGDVREEASGSGWTTTKQAAKLLGVSRRSVQGYVRRGLLEAQEQGQGVNKTFLVSIDSLNALHDRRRHEASEAAKFAEASAEAAETANQHTDTGEALRHAIERVEARTAEATELRIRLELTEQAQSTLHEELFEERRRREEAERERDVLRRRLESREPQEASTDATEQPRRVESQAAVGQAHEGAERPWWRRMFGS